MAGGNSGGCSDGGDGVVLMDKAYLKGPPPDFPWSVSFCPLRTMEMKLYDEEKVVWVCLFY